jgi:endonuclease/exonuclease/phosphatase family metal-dependent hydrolase
MMVGMAASLQSLLRGAMATGALSMQVLGIAIPVRAAAEPAPPPRIRVVTFNLFHGGATSGLTGDDASLDTRLELAAEALRALAPDVVGLQEASVNGHRGNVAARLAERLGMHHAYAPATGRVFGGGVFGWLVVTLMNFNEGPAVLSRFPVASIETEVLPRCLRRVDPRVLLRAEVQTPLGPMSVYSTHTSPDACQPRRVAEIVTGRRGALPAIVTGDFNAIETSPSIRAFGEAGFIDAFRAANPAAAGATVWQPVRAEHPMVSRRVDYVFVVPGSRFTGEVLSSRVVLDTPGKQPDGTTLWPSDHRAVVADISLIELPTAAGR